MEKPNRGSERSELDDSSDVKLVEDETQRQEDPHSQMQDQIAAEVRAETRNEMSIGLQDSVNYESEEILQPKGVKQCEESIQNSPEVLTEAPGMEYEAVACWKQGTVQETSQKAEDEAATEASDSSETVNMKLSIGKIIEHLLGPAEHTESSKMVQESIAIEGNIDYFSDSVNYECGEILQPKRAKKCEESIQNRPKGLTEAPGMQYEAVACRKQGAVQETTQMAEDEAATEASNSFETINVGVTIGKVIENLLGPAEHTESSKMTQESIAIEGNEKFPKRIKEQENVPEVEKLLEVGSIAQGEQPEQALQVRQVEQSVELVLEEAVISDARQEQMEEAEDIEEPQKYAFREKASD